MEDYEEGDERDNKKDNDKKDEIDKKDDEVDNIEDDDQRYSRSNYKKGNEDGKRYVKGKDDEEDINEHHEKMLMRRNIAQFMNKPLPKPSQSSNSYWDNIIKKSTQSFPSITMRKRSVSATMDHLESLNLMGIFLYFTAIMIIVGIITFLSVAVILTEIISLKSELEFLLKESEKLNSFQNNFSSSLLQINDTALAQFRPTFLGLQILLSNPGQFQKYPEDSCVSILRKVSSSHSGYYWVRSFNGSAIQVYCDMTRTCGGITGGWMRVAELDMTDKTVVCPGNLVLGTESNTLRGCVLDSSDGACSSSFYQTGVRVGYSKVCGMIKGYQLRSPDGFRTFLNDTRPPVTLTIDSNYIDGISLTHGFNPRKHIWSFAAGSCFCRDNKPKFVKNSFFCDGVPYRQCSQFCENVVLWDAVRCDTQSTPWFYQQLPQTATDSVEMRLCRDQNRDNEDVTIEAVSLYIQ